MEERASTRWPSCARRNCGRIPSRVVCLCFAAGEERRSRILVYDGQGFWLAQKRLSKGRFVWWPSGKEPTRVLQAHQAQMLLAAGNPEAIAAPVWRRVSA